MHTKSVCAQHKHEEPQHAWMHVLRHTCGYIFGGTDENERKLMITAGTQKQTSTNELRSKNMCTVTLENAVQWQLSHTNIKYI